MIVLIAGFFATGIADLAAATPVPRILALGDSLTAGLGVAANEAFPAQLQRKLKERGLDVTITNAGVSGDTTAGGLARLDWALADKPDFALVELGANDSLRGLDPKSAYDNLDKILARLKDKGIPTLILGMLAPANWGKDYQRDFAAIFPKLADKYGMPLYPFFLEGVAMAPELNQPDMLHPNPKGVAVIVDRIAPYVERLVAGQKEQG